MGSSYLKTCMFVFVLGVNKDTIFVIYDTILCLFIELCFMCASLFFFLSHKSLHGQIEATARLSLAPLAVFILAVLTLFLGMAMEWLLSHQLMPWYLAVILICQVVQMVFPVFLRLMHKNMDNDESLVFKFKMVSTGLSILTSIYDCWSFGTHTFNDGKRKWYIVTVCIVCAACKFLQGAVRFYGPERMAKHLEAPYDKMTDKLNAMRGGIKQAREDLFDRFHSCWTTLKMKMNFN